MTRSFTLRSRRIALVLGMALMALLLAHLSIGSAAAETPTLPTRCVNFQSLPGGAAMGVGTTFTDSGINMRTLSFQWDNGAWTNGGVAVVDALNAAGGTGLELNLNNITVAFSLGQQPASLIRLRFGEYGGNLNIKLNNDFRNFQNMQDIDGAVIGGVAVQVPTGGNGNDMGTLRLSGTIHSFSIGGQEFYIDDVCITR